jgi:ABC-type transport system substrate-binding protein
MVPSSSKARLSFAVLIQEQLRLAGVNVSVEKMDPTAMFARAGARKFDAMMGGLITTPPPSGVTQAWTSAAGASSGLNYGRYESRSFDAQVDSAVNAASRSVAKTHYRAAYQLIVDDAPAIWLYEPPILIGVNDRLVTGALRPDAWWTGVPDWSIAPGKRLPRDVAAKTP